MIMVGCIFCSPIFGASPEGIDDTIPELDNLTNYPRIERYEQGSVQVDFPTLESWPDFHFLRAWLPVEVSLNGESGPRVGSAYVQAVTDINFEQRTVAISELKVLKTKFADESELKAVEKLTSMAFQGRESIVPLDVLLRLLPESFEIPTQGGELPTLNFEPPAILVSESPLKLLSIDKEPVKAKIEGTALEFVVNTNWNVFYNRTDEQWYVLNEGTWQQNNYLSDGGWTTTGKLPADFDKLALNDDWKDVHDALPASIPSEPPTPFVISLQATELVQLDGTPRLSKIDETDISFVSNTQSDLFSQKARWYLLVSGRWFSSSDLKGKWQSVTKLPNAFTQIPDDHKKAHALYSVPGTRQAKLSLIEAALPHRVSVAKGAGADIEVSWVGEPRFETIENTELQRGLNTPFQIIKHNNFYYLCYEGAWYFSASSTGAWKVAQQIPKEIYRIPATDPAYNVTFVRLSEQQNETQAYVDYNYSSGYEGSFSTRASVVYGTGWYYPTSVYWDSVTGPAYWNYGLTYGYNTAYHPVGAYYGHRSGFYGRRGGYGRWGGYGGWGAYGGYPTYSSVTIEGPTRKFNHGYEGPLQTTPGDPTKTADKSLDKFLPKKKIDGTEKFVKTSQENADKPARVSAASLYASTTLSSNRFSGPDGEVYKHEGQQWSQYNEGNWATMQAIEKEQRVYSQSPQRSEPQKNERWLPAHKRTLSRSELDRQELARLEGMDNYSKYRMKKDAAQ